MTADDPTGTTPAGERRPPTASGGASCRLGYPNGLPKASVPAQGSGDGPAGSRTRAHGDRPDVRHQGAPHGGEAAAGPEPPPYERPPAFPDRPPRRRTYQSPRREAVIAVRFTAEEKAEIAAAAERAGVFPAGFLATVGLTVARDRDTLLRADEQLDAAVDELAALRAQISRVGNNLNQIARAHNAGGRPHPGVLNHALTALVRTLARIDLAADALARRRTQ